MEVNSSKKQLQEYFDQPIFYNNTFPEYVLQENILDHRKLLAMCEYKL